jgi:hypothetical protein
VDRVAKGVEDRSNLWIDGFAVNPGVAGRQSEVFGEGPGAVDANDSGVNAQMAPPGPAVATPTTD